MGLREWLNQRDPRLVIATVAVCLAAVAAVLVFLLRDESSALADGDAGTPQAFFSVDQGKSWFADDARKIPPFQKDGKEAVRVYVYKCADGKEFVACLQRYTPELKRKLEAVNAGSAAGGPMLDEANGIEVRAPGQSGWIKQSDPRAMAIMRPKCRNGEYAQMVMP